jgi:hypothetical protein
MLRDFRTFFSLSLIALMSLIPLLFSSDEMNTKEIDVYLFFDYQQYPELIAYDIVEICSVTFFIYLIWRLMPTRRQKRYVGCFLISSIINIFGYFMFYSQFVSLLQIPILISMITYIYFKYDNEKGSNIR